MFEASNMRRTTPKSSYATAICVEKNERGLPSFEGSFGSSQSTIAADWHTPRSSRGESECTLGSSDFEKFFENCFGSCSFGLAKNI